MGSTIKAVDIDENFHDVDVSDVVWRPSVYGIVIDDNKILLSPQHGKGHDLPGGGVNINESFEDAVIREVKEETGIDVSVVRLLGLRDNFFKVTFREPQDVYHSVMVYYLCQKVGGGISVDGLDANEVDYVGTAEWVALEKIDYIHPAASYDWREFVREVIQ